MSFSHYDEDGARTSHHTHCCIGARRATHCATGDEVPPTNRSTPQPAEETELKALEIKKCAEIYDLHYDDSSDVE